MRKALFISPCGTHPSAEGNCRRVRTLVEAFERLGYDVHFALALTPDKPDNDIKQMREHWGDRLTLLNSPGYPQGFSRLRHRLRRLIFPTVEWITRVPYSAMAALSLDRYYYRWWNVPLRLLQLRHRFDVVVVEYVFLSRALQAFGRDTLKILDTHDVFADRSARLREGGFKSSWYTTDPKAEAAGLSRADLIFAIQEGEAEYFRRIVSRPVLAVPHFPDSFNWLGSQVAGSSLDLLAVGSKNEINVHGIRWFISRVLPLVRQQVPTARLRVVGSASLVLAHELAGVDGVDFVGVVEQLEDEYRRACVAVNPVSFGTGLAIKSVEAIAAGVPLVTTTAGARGIPIGSGSHHVVDDEVGMAGKIVELLRSPEQRLVMGERGREFMRGEMSRVLALMAEVLRLRAPSVDAPTGMSIDVPSTLTGVSLGGGAYPSGRGQEVPSDCEQSAPPR